MQIVHLSLILIASIIILFILSVNANAKNNPISQNTQATPITPIIDSPKYQYMGCYVAPMGGVNLENTLKGNQVSVDSCHTAAVNMQAKYFSIGNANEDGLGKCMYGDDYIGTDKSPNCIIRDDAGNLLGGSFAEAVYTV